MEISWRTCLILLVIVSAIPNTEALRFEKRPRLYGERVPNRIISPRLRRVQRRVVILHDFFRTKVSPPASNMLKMKWHNGAAKSAQKWAEQCKLLTHDTTKGRHIDNYGSCGQNIFVSTQKVPWLFAMRMWYAERQNFTYGSPNNDLNLVGHYTTMVWAATHQVGCGLARCMKGGPRNRPFYNYVCNYCPIGNHDEKLGLPYKRGRTCGTCPYNCQSTGKSRMCTNACHAADLWGNCRELFKAWSGWLCNTATKEGLERQRNCLATCTCHNKIKD